jgi:Zn-dependent protease with chaperone function
MEAYRIFAMTGKYGAALFIAFLFLISCVTAPYTGRSQLMLVSESSEVESGEQAYRYILRDSVLSDNSGALRVVNKVGEKIARAAEKTEYRWQFRVINDPESVNAFCVPGGKVAVYTGIFPVARDEAGLAVILGHEVAHALLRHSGERMSQTQILGTGLALAGAGGLNPQILQALGLGASVGVVLPFSRSQESEADHVGLILMAKAGYDPRVSIELVESDGPQRKKWAARFSFDASRLGSAYSAAQSMDAGGLAILSARGAIGRTSSLPAGAGLANGEERARVAEKDPGCQPVCGAAEWGARGRRDAGLSIAPRPRDRSGANASSSESGMVNIQH